MLAIAAIASGATLARPRTARTMTAMAATDSESGVATMAMPISCRSS